MTKSTPLRILLLRHGNTFQLDETPTQVGQRTDLPLTEQGRNQAQGFAKHLATQSIHPCALYAGSLKRQIEGAQIIQKGLESPVKLFCGEEALTEIDYGPWEGLTTAEIRQRWPDEYRAWTTQGKWPVLFGNSLDFHRNSIKRWLERLRAAYAENQTVVAVSSNGILRLFYSLQEGLWESLSGRAQIECLKVQTGHFCELLLCKDSVQITGWNLSPSSN